MPDSRWLVLACAGASAWCAACGDNNAGSTDAPSQVIDAPPADAAVSPRCQITPGTHVVKRQVGYTDDLPVLLVSPPHDDRLFVVEKPGTIRILVDGVPQDPPFVDLRDTSGGPVISTAREQGLLGLAFHPDYANNRKLYVFYTQSFQYRRNVLAELTTFADDPDHADRASLRDFIVIRDFESNHNGGMIAFDRDGYLVIGTGDGGSGGDPNDNGQDPNELLAKLLRIDVDHPGETTPYSIPPTNPYVLGGGAPEVLAIGLRNPWRWSFDSATGDIYIGDVGQNRWEEVDVMPPDQLAGANFGWNVREGAHCFPPTVTTCDTTGLTDPVIEFAHQQVEQHCANIGGEVYRGACYPDLVGRYFFTDFCAGTLRSFRYENGAAVDLQVHGDFVVDGPTSLRPDAYGELFVTTEGGRVFAVEVAP